MSILGANPEFEPPTIHAHMSPSPRFLIWILPLLTLNCQTNFLFASPKSASLHLVVWICGFVVAEVVFHLPSTRTRGSNPNPNQPKPIQTNPNQSKPIQTNPNQSKPPIRGLPEAAKRLKRFNLISQSPAFLLRRSGVTSSSSRSLRLCIPRLDPKENPPRKKQRLQSCNP